MFCTDGVLELGVFFGDGRHYEERFALDDGSFSASKTVPLAVTTHTIEDFNGPGFDCTFQAASAASLVVPVDATLAE